MAETFGSRQQTFSSTSIKRGRNFGDEKGEKRDLICSDRHRFQKMTDNDWERVKVTVRVRPSNNNEEGKDVPNLYINSDENTVILRRQGGIVDYTEFKFDAVLAASASQADVYNAAAESVVSSVLDGYNGTIMAYGQTGAGKTYTLSDIVLEEGGESRIEGIIPRSVAHIFQSASLDYDHEYHISVSYIQIYMETIQDLLRPENSNLQLREGENGAVFISGVEENAHSSRSHAIVIITVEKKTVQSIDSMNFIEDEEKRASKGHPSVVKITVGKLHLVDLAGSERLKKSRSEGLRASEAVSVNMSLTTLGKCISARADPSTTHVPFRDSKLTRLLQESLGGNAKTSLIINISPCSEYVQETLSSLQFGSRAMKVGTKAIVNFEDGFRMVKKSFQEELKIQDTSTTSAPSQEEEDDITFLEMPHLEHEVKGHCLIEEQDEPFAIYEKFLQEQRRRTEEWQNRLEIIKAAAKRQLYDQESRDANMNCIEVIASKSEGDKIDSSSEISQLVKPYNCVNTGSSL